jgi:hypothetical protein
VGLGVTAKKRPLKEAEKPSRDPTAAVLSLADWTDPCPPGKPGRGSGRGELGKDAVGVPVAPCDFEKTPLNLVRLGQVSPSSLRLAGSPARGAL